MENNLSSFLNWLAVTMEETNVTPADIARTKFVTDSAVSLLFSGVTKSVSVNMCRAISKATKVPLITVYRKAGLLPTISLSEQEIEEIMEEAAKLNPQDRAEALAFIRLKQNLRNKNG
jgi:transcriptional regulator with XRE-family HTH domain